MFIPPKACYLFAPHPPAGDFEVVLSSVAEVMRASLQQILHRFLRLKQNVHIASCKGRKAFIYASYLHLFILDIL
jgi:hypothetical protein